MVPSPYRLRWRFYRTSVGADLVRDDIRALPDEDQAAIYALMLEARREGLRVARSLGDDLWELRAVGVRRSYRLLFAQEGRSILLAVDVYQKQTQKLPPRVKQRALQRLADWRGRGSG